MDYNYTKFDQMLYNFINSGDENKALEYIECLKNNQVRGIFLNPEDDKLEKHVDALLYTDSSGKCIFDYIMQKDVYISYFYYAFITEDIRIIRKLIKSGNYNPLIITEDVLFSEFEPNKLIIEYLLENDKLSDSFMVNIQNHIEIVDICRKYNRSDLLSLLHENILLMKRENNGETILEELLKEYIFPEFPEEFQNKQTLNILLKMHVYGVLLECSLDMILSLANVNETYLDLILSEYSHNNLNTIYIEQPMIDRDNFKNTALAYIIYARHGFIDCLETLGPDILLSKDTLGNRLIDCLLEIDKELTINTVINKMVLENVDLATYLRIKNIIVSDIDLSLHRKEMSLDYLDKKEKEQSKVIISEEDENLLDEFRSLMLSDNKSDEETIDAVVNVYRIQISNNNPYAIKEIQSLIRIKREVSDFCIIKSDEESSYSDRSKTIKLNDTDSIVINHEIGHALFDLLALNSFPHEFNGLLLKVKKAKSIDGFYDNVDKYSKRYYQIKEDVGDFVEREYMSEYDKLNTEERIKEIEEFLGRTKEEKISEFITLGYTKEELDSILSGMFSVEEFLKHDRRIKKRELTSTIFQKEYGSWIVISDILDAMCHGYYYDGLIKNSEDQKIKATCGHGVDYYQNSLDVFNEIIANYSSICKAENSDEVLNYLRQLVGDEFVDFIKNYYEESIVESNRYIDSQGIKM